MGLVHAQGRVGDAGSHDGDDDDHADRVWILSLALAAAFAAAGWFLLFPAPDEDRHGPRLVSAVTLFVLAYVLTLRGLGRREMADTVSSLGPVIRTVLVPLPVPRSKWQLPKLIGLYRSYVVTVSTSEALIVGTSYYSPASYCVSVSVPWTSPRWSAIYDLCRYGERDAALSRAVREVGADMLNGLKRQGDFWRGPFLQPRIGYQRGRRGGSVYYCAARPAPLESLTREQFEEQVEFLVRVVRVTSERMTRWA